MTESVNDSYSLDELIWTGDNTKIYKGRYGTFERPVAIKLLVATADKSKLKRFQNEALATAAVSHPNIIKLYDFGMTPECEPYMVTDYLEGKTLQYIVEHEGPLSIERFRALFHQICGAMAHAHARGVVHLDLKPTNFLVVKDESGEEVPVIFDFRIARVLQMKDDEELQNTGEIQGTPFYMSPEQCKAERAAKPSDIYTLGCTMFYTLTGMPPFPGTSSIDTMEMHMNMPPPEGKMDKALEKIVLKALAKKPEKRYKSMEELGELIGGKPVDRGDVGEAADEGEPEGEKKKWWWPF